MVHGVYSCDSGCDSTPDQWQVLAVQHSPGEWKQELPSTLRGRPRESERGGSGAHALAGDHSALEQHQAILRHPGVAQPVYHLVKQDQDIGIFRE